MLERLALERPVAERDLAADRAGEARATTSETGKRRSARIASISRPTLPVAPATATLKPDMTRIPFGSSASPLGFRLEADLRPAPRRGGQAEARFSRSSRLSGRRVFVVGFDRQSIGTVPAPGGRRAPTGFGKSWHGRVVNAAICSLLRRRSGRAGGELARPPRRRVNMRVSTICFDRRSVSWLRIERDHNLGQRKATCQSRQTRTGFRRSKRSISSEFADRSRAEGSLQGDRPARIAKAIVVFVPPRTEAISVVSMRFAGERERNLFDDR